MTSHQPVIIAVTGGIACGKSETGRVLSEQGFTVLDTDLLAHELMKRGRPLFEKVVARFGGPVVGENGEINRKVLGGIVFSDDEAREELNALVHPVVIDETERWIKRQTADVAVLIPLLYETGWVDGWDAVICVSSTDEQIVQRLRGRGLNEAEARGRISAQMPLEEKEQQADFVIVNNETLNELRSQVIQTAVAVQSRKSSHE